MRGAWNTAVLARVGGAVVAAALAAVLVAPRQAMAVGNVCTPNPCANGGDTGATCAVVSGVPGYKCSCSAGFTPGGSTCVRVNPCVPNHCQDAGDKGAVCHPSGSTYTCSCDAGYASTGGSCVPAANPCARNPCANGGDTGATCHASGTTYTCSCDAGYSFMGGTCLKPPPK